MRTSAFGPASILSLGGTSPPANNTYSQLAGQAGIVQFDLASVLMPGQGTALWAPSQRMSEADSQALEDAFDLIEIGALDQAESTLQDILEKNKNNGAVTHALGFIEAERGNLKAAEKMYNRADFLAPNRGYGDDARDVKTLTLDNDQVFEKASELVQSADTRKRGIRLFLRLAERQPNDAETRIALAEGLLADNDIINGMAELFRAVGVSDKSQLARIESRTEELIERMPQVPQLQRLLGRTQRRLGKFAQALDTLNGAARLAGSDVLVKSELAMVHAGIGRELLAQGQVSRALIQLDRARDFDPTNPEVREARAEGYLAHADRLSRLGDQRSAILGYSEAAAALGPAGSESIKKMIAGGSYAAGLRLEQQTIAAGGDIDEEVLAFQAAHNLDPDNIIYKRKLGEARTTLGDQFLADGEFADAVAAYQRAYDLYPVNETYRDNLIDAGQQHGDDLLSDLKYDEAIAAYRSAYQVNVYNATSKSKLANGYNVRGLDHQVKSRFTQAVLDFKEALALFPDNSEYQANYDALSSYDV